MMLRNGLSGSVTPPWLFEELLSSMRLMIVFAVAVSLIGSASARDDGDSFELRRFADIALSGCLKVMARRFYEPDINTETLGILHWSYCRDFFRLAFSTEQVPALGETTPPDVDALMAREDYRKLIYLTAALAFYEHRKSLTR
jgi:hypothetical protein